MRIKYIALLCVLGMAIVSRAQHFDLKVVTIMSPPFSSYVGYYCTTGGPLEVRLYNDAKEDRTIGLRLVLERNTGGRMETRPGSTFPHIRLKGGEHRTLEGMQLAAYFDAGNLMFKGLPAASYLRDQRVADGFYTICFEAFDPAGGKLQTIAVPARVWLACQRAPKFIQPASNEDIYIGDSKRFYIEWLPLHDKSSGIEAVEYDFFMAELPYSYTGPVDAVFFSFPVIFKRTVSATSLLLDFAHIPVRRGFRYACRLHIRVKTDKTVAKLFENDGYSQAISFVYKGVCPVPVPEGINFLSGHMAELTWKAVPEASRYTVLLRESGAESSQWERYDLTQPYLRRPMLTQDKRYEYKIRAYCKSQPSAYSDTYHFALPAAEQPLSYQVRLPLTGKTEVRYNAPDSSLFIINRPLKDSVGLDVRQAVRCCVPVSIIDPQGVILTIPSNRLK